MLRYKTETSLV